MIYTCYYTLQAMHNIYRLQTAETRGLFEMFLRKHIHFVNFQKQKGHTANHVALRLCCTVQHVKY